MVTQTLASGSATLAQMSQTYLAITTFMAPLAFVLAVNSDALRNEGRVGLMAAMSLLVSLSNIGFNYVVIALLGLGVAGLAYGAALAQLLALGIIAALIYCAMMQLAFVLVPQTIAGRFVKDPAVIAELPASCQLPHLCCGWQVP